MNAAPDQTIIIGLQIFLDQWSNWSSRTIHQKFVMTYPPPPLFMIIFQHKLFSSKHIHLRPLLSVFSLLYQSEYMPHIFLLQTKITDMCFKLIQKYLVSVCCEEKGHQEFPPETIEFPLSKNQTKWPIELWTLKKEIDDDHATMRESFSLVQIILFNDYTDVVAAHQWENMVENTWESKQFGLFFFITDCGGSSLVSLCCMYYEYLQKSDKQKGRPFQSAR